MEKKIEDYLHLYLNSSVSVYVFPDDTLTDGWLKNILTKHPNLNYQVPLNIESYYRILKDEYKPILRQLSSLTPEEKKKCDDVYYLIATSDADDMETITKATAHVNKYLLSIGVDLFGLIDAGLAIDKTTTNP